MNKQSISFKADEQKLIKTGGIEHYASNIVAYIEATFDLGANWNGYDSVRAVWSNDYLTDISTVLDNNGKCIVPTEVLADTGNVTVNLVGSIADGDTLTDRLTTYPCKAVIVDADAKVEGDETESITPSQFEQFVEIVHDEVEQVTGMTAEAETLPAGSDATASYSDGVLSLGIPQGIQGEQGEQGETGETGAPAGFGDVTASVDNTVGTPSVNVHTSGPDTAKEFDFAFHNLKGDKGDTGDTGATGNGIASTVLNPDYTLTITFTDGTSYTTPSIRGAKGDTGNTGATGNGIQSTVLNADYTLTITFTDGTSYTTPSIRGEQGPVGPVSDVTVNGTSVVDQNGVAVITMPELVKTVQGNPIVLDDAFGPVKNLTVELLPIQAGTGTPSPQNVRPITGHDSVTVGVTGKNIFGHADGAYTIGSTRTATITGGAWSYKVNTQATSQVFLPEATIRAMGIGALSAGTYVFSLTSDALTAAKISNCTLNLSDGQAVKNGNSFTVSNNTTIVSITSQYIEQYAVGTYTCEIQIEHGNTATSYEPYKSQTKTVTLPHTVYGAGVGVTSGNGKDKYAFIVDMGTLAYNLNAGHQFYATLPNRASFNANNGICSVYEWGDAYNGGTDKCIQPRGSYVWIQDSAYSDVNALKQAMNGVQLCYELETPLDLSTTPTSLTLYNGDNVISSDGDMELTYVQDMAAVIRKIENQL